MVRLFDNTLRDGGNVVGHGFPIALTESIVQALLSCSIADIECGNCKGLGAYDKLGATQAPSDEEYFSALQPYLPQGRIGMFLLAKLADRELVRRAADAGLHFLRVGANAGDGAGSVQAVSLVKEAGLTCRYSLMKGYILSPAALAQEARMLQDAGVDRITIMDSAGTMFPEQAADYVKALKVKALIKKAFDAAFEKFDVILSPAAPTTALPVGQALSDPLKMYLGDIYTVSVNLAGLPAVTMPCGFDKGGLPVGAQLIGKPHGEGTILNAAHTYQLHTDFHKKVQGGALK